MPSSKNVDASFIFFKMSKLNIVVTGCLHGHWDELLDSIDGYNQSGTHIDFAIVAGDAQTFRTESDMESFAAPQKYHLMGSFYKIFTGERVSPCPIIVVGGNHEASDLFLNLPFGGWIAPNVFYTGKANSINVGSVSISCLSGIPDNDSYFRPCKEKYPLKGPKDIRTCYYPRAFSDFQLSGLFSTDLFVSHEWPSSIPSRYGGNYLKQRRNDIIQGDLKDSFGHKMGMHLINTLKPKYWFAAHHHLYFYAKINENTNFLALPKPPKNDWSIIYNIEGTMGPIMYRGMWLSILKATENEMKSPKILKGANWSDLWSQKLVDLTPFDDQEVDPYCVDPIQYTINFCKKYGIFCPAPHIQDQIMK